MNNESSAIPPGRIDIHSHMLPGVDDGCAHIDHCAESIVLLQREGFVGSICTPHIWPEQYPANTPEHIGHWTAAMVDELRKREINYRLWVGAELRLHPRVIEWMEESGVPTLADSRCVLVDLWVDKWPRWADRALDWLMTEGYQPILAHPERLNIKRRLEQRLTELIDRGVWLQGNFRCMTGEDGAAPDQMIRRLLEIGAYTFLSTDMHRPDTLASRIDGMDMIASAIGQSVVDQMTVDNPRRLVLGVGE